MPFGSMARPLTLALSGQKSSGGGGGGGPTDITLSNDTIPVNETIVGALGMVGGTPPPTFTVTSVTGA